MISDVPFGDTTLAPAPISPHSFRTKKAHYVMLDVFVDARLRRAQTHFGTFSSRRCLASRLAGNTSRLAKSARQEVEY